MNDDSLTSQELLEAVIRIAYGAGEVIMAVYAGDFNVRGKGDASPVTEADTRAETFILAKLREQRRRCPSWRRRPPRPGKFRI